MPFCIGWVENFDEIALSRTVKEIEANLCFAQLEYMAEIPCGSKILTKLLYLARLGRWKEICVLPFLAKIQNGCHFRGGEIFWENWQEYIS